jgi:hypothetical protein
MEQQRVSREISLYLQIVAVVGGEVVPVPN